MTLKNFKIPCNFNNLILPLANPERFLLDQIFVASITRMRGFGIDADPDTDIIVDKYPLSTLYNEWKRYKEAARGSPPLRRTELDVAKAQIAELQAHLRILMVNPEACREADRATDRAKEADLAKQNVRLREALHVAVQTPNPREVVPGANATAATAKATSSNATSLTNATAAADPM